MTDWPGESRGLYEREQGLEDVSEGVYTHAGTNTYRGQIGQLYSMFKVIMEAEMRVEMRANPDAYLCVSRICSFCMSPDGLHCQPSW